MAPLPVNGKGLDVLLVRHGESTNNVVMAQAHAARLAKGAAATQEDLFAAEREFCLRRSDDPALSPKGFKEAECVGEAYAPALLKQGVCLYASPLKRALQTAAPLATALGAQMICQPDCHEVGGCFGVKDGARSGTGRSLTAAEIKKQFSADVGRLPAEGGWYTGVWETDAEGRARCARVAKWLRDPALHAEVGSKCLVIVCHAHFIDLLFKALLELPDEAESDIQGHNAMQNRPCFFASRNASAARISVTPDQLVIQSFSDTEHLNPVDQWHAHAAVAKEVALLRQRVAALEADKELLEKRLLGKDDCASRDDCRSTDGECSSAGSTAGSTSPDSLEKDGHLSTDSDFSICPTSPGSGGFWPA